MGGEGWTEEDPFGREQWALLSRTPHRYSHEKFRFRIGTLSQDSDEYGIGTYTVLVHTRTTGLNISLFFVATTTFILVLSFFYSQSLISRWPNLTFRTKLPLWLSVLDKNQILPHVLVFFTVIVPIPIQ